MPKPFEVGKTYKTTLGHDARVLATDVLNGSHTENVLDVVAVISDPFRPSGHQTVRRFLPDGTGRKISSGNLIPERDVRKAYLLIFANGTVFTACSQMPRAAQSLAASGLDLTIKEVEYEM